MATPAPSSLAGEGDAPAFWTGKDVLVLNPQNRGGQVAGELWSPVTNTARPIASSGMSWRANPAVAWTGRELLVVGGSSGPTLTPFARGYDPATNSWRTLRPPDDLRADELVMGPAVWTGHELFVWRAARAYDPSTDTWRSTASAPAELSSVGVTSVWAGDRLVVWGGCRTAQCDERNESVADVGATYDPVTDRWAMLPRGPVVGSVHAVAVWSGREVVYAPSAESPEGVQPRPGAYDPIAGTWRVLPSSPMTERRFASGVWVGDRLVVWGGAPIASREPMSDGWSFDPVTNTWARYELVTASPRSSATMVWAGDSIYVTATGPANRPFSAPR